MSIMDALSTMSLGLDVAGGIKNLFGGKGMSANMQMAKQYDYQRMLNQTAIQDRVADANKAGIHPLYALGASLNPGGVSMPDQSGPSLGDRLSNMGQNISRSIMAKQSQEERILSIEMAREDLKGKKLQNDILGSQAINARTQLPPSLPDQGKVKVVDKNIMPSDKYGEESGHEPALKYVDLPGLGPIRVRGKGTEEATEDSHLTNLSLDLGYTVPDIGRNVIRNLNSYISNKFKNTYSRALSRKHGFKGLRY